MPDMKLDIPELITLRLCLTPLSLEHSIGMFDMWKQGAVQEYSGPVKDQLGKEIHLPVKNKSDSDRLIHFWISAAASGWGFRWAILLTGENSSFVGHIGFNSLGVCSEIAYHLNPDYWGKGIMLEAAMSAIDWIGSKGSSQIEAYIDPMNTKSIALAENLGMTATGALSEGTERYLRTL